MKKLSKKSTRKDNLAGYLFTLPYIIGLVFFTAYPFFSSLYYSFTDYDILSSPNWVGLKNYIEMFTKDEKFWISFRVTLKFAFIQVPLKLCFSLLVALVLSKATRLTGIYRAVFYIPSLLGGGVAVAITWKRLWGESGVINVLLGGIGIKGPSWLANPKTAIYALILLGVWQFGSQMLIFLAAIKDVPMSLHEAAIMDGAGGAARFFRITLPMITPALFYNLIQGIIGSLQAFNSAFLVTNGGPLNSTLYYALYQYRQAFEYRHMGYASAMAWFMMLVIVAFTALVFRSSSGWVYYRDEL